ncbi:hypothetical protein JOD52_001217 [Brachybacterium muris]|nr:hypothetical protein [Brachybacterium muris]
MRFSNTGLRCAVMIAFERTLDAHGIEIPV